MSAIHWLAVPTVTLIVLILLLWGMRRAPYRPGVMEEDGASMSSPEDAQPLPFIPSLEPLSSSLVSARRLIAHIWQADTPDLTVAYWLNHQYSTIRFTSYQQCFLPLDTTVADALGAMESRLYDTALEQDVPERSRLVTAWSFIHLPSRRQDLVVRSHFSGGRLAHDFYLMDADGKLGPIALEPDTGGDLLLGPAWYPYRNLLTQLEQDTGESRAESFRALCASDCTRPKAHAWLAAEANRHEASHADVLRYTAVALELDPDNCLARLEKSRLDGRSGLHAFVMGLKDFLASQTDDEAQAGYLLAQSLLALGQDTAARLLCQVVLKESGHHDATWRLLRLIQQRERGAQT